MVKFSTNSLRNKKANIANLVLAVPFGIEKTNVIGSSATLKCNSLKPHDVKFLIYKHYMVQTNNVTTVTKFKWQIKQFLSLPDERKGRVLTIVRKTTKIIFLLCYSICSLQMMLSKELVDFILQLRSILARCWHLDRTFHFTNRISEKYWLHPLKVLEFIFQI